MIHRAPDSSSDAPAPAGAARAGPTSVVAPENGATIRRALADGAELPVVGAAPAGDATVRRSADEGGARPVVTARAAGGQAGDATVRRSPAERLVLARPVAAVSAAGTAAGTVQRQAATPTPPPGAPPAELPTMTARGSEPAEGGAQVGRLADQVYEILVRRLNSERRQRGW
jgi:hypothetical protein